MQKLSERIKIIRNSAKLTQSQFGEKLSVSASYVSRLESGKEQPTKMLLKLIALTFNVSTDWLENGVGDITVNKTTFDYCDRGYNEEAIKGLNQELENIKLFVDDNKEFPIALNLSAIIGDLNKTLITLSNNPSVGKLIFEEVTSIILEICYQLDYIMSVERTSPNFEFVMYKKLLILSESINENIKNIDIILSNYGNLLNK